MFLLRDICREYLFRGAAWVGSRAYSPFVLLAIAMAVYYCLKKSMEFFHAKDLHKLESGKPFTISFVKKNGEAVTVKGATMTSFYSNGLTMKIKFPGYNHPVTLRRSQVTAINNKEIIV